MAVFRKTYKPTTISSGRKRSAAALLISGAAAIGSWVCSVGKSFVPAARQQEVMSVRGPSAGCVCIDSEELLLDSKELSGGERLLELIHEAAAGGNAVAAAYVGEKSKAPAGKSQCLHPDKGGTMWACADCPRGRGKIAGCPAAVAAAAVIGETTEPPSKTQCLHPNQPVMFACNDCPRKGKMALSTEDQPDDVLAAAAYAGETKPAPHQKTQCLHPDKPTFLACADCPRKR